MKEICEVLYSSDADAGFATSVALYGITRTLQRIEATDQLLEKPIMDRDFRGVAVALKQGAHSVDSESILSIGRYGPNPEPAAYELFIAKAANRAFLQMERDLTNDTEPMEYLAWLPDNEIHRASGATVNGVHVGFAGGWAHHGRQIAISYASTLAHTLNVPEPASIRLETRLLLDSEANRRLDWLNEGHNSGDGGVDSDMARELISKYRFVADLVEVDLT